MKIMTPTGEVLATIRPKIIDNRQHLEHVNFSLHLLDHAIFDDLVFTLADLNGASCRGAFLSKVMFQGADLSDADLSESTVRDTLFYDVFAYEAKFRRASLRDVCFRGSNLCGADFSDSSFVSVSFEKDNINHATDISGANLSNVDLSSSVFDGVEYNEATLFPRNFNPASRPGLIKKRTS